MSRRVGFTLPEALLTLAISGVFTAIVLSMPMRRTASHRTQVLPTLGEPETVVPQRGEPRCARSSEARALTDGSLLCPPREPEW